MMTLKEIALRYQLPTYFTGAIAMSVAGDQSWLAPHVECGSSDFAYWQVDASTTAREVDTRISVMGDAPAVIFPGTEKTGKLQAHGIDVPFPKAALGNAASVAMKLKDQGKAAVNLVEQSRLRDTLTLINSVAGAGTDLSLASSVDFVATLQGAIEDVIKGTLGWANGMEIRFAWGPSAARKFGGHSSVKGYTTGGATKDKGGMVNIDKFSTLFQDNSFHRKLNAVRVTSNVNAAAVASEFYLGDSVYVYACAPNPTAGDPSAIKTFGLSPESLLDFYTPSHGRTEVAKVDLSFQVQATNTLAIKRFNFVA